MNYALLSVSNKSGIVDFARGLVSAGYTLISSGGTHAIIQAEGIPVTKVSEYTGSPEILNGRVKTLHPKFMVVFLLNVVILITIWIVKQMM